MLFYTAPFNALFVTLFIRMLEGTDGCSGSMFVRSAVTYNTQGRLLPACTEPVQMIPHSAILSQNYEDLKHQNGVCSGHTILKEANTVKESCWLLP